MKTIFTLLYCLVLMASCKNQAGQETTAETGSSDTMQVKYTLTPFSSSKEFPDASLKAMAYANGTFSTVIAGSTYKLGEQTSDAPEKSCANSKEGQHLHLIVDTEPYVAKYESSFAQDIPDGDHYLLCFLSRSYHESIKTPAAHKAVKANVKAKSITKMEDVAGPMLFYSRPKGVYTGDDTKKVMLDYYLVNADQPGFKVEADINGEKHLLDKWQPYYIEGLPEGDNTIKLSLLDSTGQLVNVPLNPVSRTFKIEKTPAAN
ncbi:MAG: phosphopeptide-binding protein [Saprospiraceae bacterium]|nr:phosphopeptide-binding protein [Candidatus Opimibacter iunctus]